MPVTKDDDITREQFLRSDDISDDRRRAALRSIWLSELASLPNPNFAQNRSEQCAPLGRAVLIMWKMFFGAETVFDKIAATGANAGSFFSAEVQPLAHLHLHRRSRGRDLLGDL